MQTRNRLQQPRETSSASLATRINALRGIAAQIGVNSGGAVETGNTETAPTAAAVPEDTYLKELRKEIFVMLISGVPILILSIIIMSYQFSRSETDEKEEVNVTDSIEEDSNVTSCARRTENKLIFWVITNLCRNLFQICSFSYMLLKKVNVSPETNAGKFRINLDNFGLFWDFVGVYMLLTSEDCTGSKVFNYTAGIVALELVEMFIPFIILLLLLPVICCCLPCFLRRLNVMRESRGNEAILTRIPIIIYGIVNNIECSSSIETKKVKETSTLVVDLRDGENDMKQCSICLSDFKCGEELRLLPCSGMHYFHKACVDDWLKINDTCPCCREHVLSASKANFFFDLAKATKTRQQSQADVQDSSLQIV